MNCRDVRGRLVALGDGELSPGEQTRVLEHLSSCASCRHQMERIGQVEVAPSMMIPSEVERRLELRLDGPALRRAAESRPRRTRAWWVRETRLPPGAMVAYALILTVVMAWGLSNWVEARSLELALEQQQVPESVLPVEQFMPASWSPEESEDDLF